MYIFFLIIRRLTRSTLFPYTTLFRSLEWVDLMQQYAEAKAAEAKAGAGNLQTILKAREEFARMGQDRKSTRLNSSHVSISYAVFCLKKKNKIKKYTMLRILIGYNE